MTDPVAVLGIGMHPWGKWGRPFQEYALIAARKAVADAGIDLSAVGFLVAAGSVRCGYAGHVAAATVARGLHLPDVEAVTVYGACASGAQALAVARDRILAGRCDVALVVGADVAQPIGQPPEKGSLSGPAVAEDAQGVPNRAWLGLRASRRLHECGTTMDDLHRVRVKNSAHGARNPQARFRSPLSPREIEFSPMVASPLRLLHISTFSDGAAAVVIASEQFARRRGEIGVRIRSISLSALTGDGIEMPYLSAQLPGAEDRSGRAANVERTLREGGVAPAELSAIELYDVSPVSELDWYEHIGLCAPGNAELLSRAGATAHGGRSPVNVSGGLASFGEAVSAQALAQVCELTRQLQGRCGARQIDGARSALAVSDGMYGNVASVLLTS